jgi:uroporphyrinogen-III synthase
MSFSGASVLSFESRRATEMAELIRINGGNPFVAPAVVEAPLEHNEQAFQFAERLFAGEFDMMIFLTGVGARFLDRVLASRFPEAHFRDSLRKIAIVVRGPKPSAVMREWNVPVAVVAPEPSTWREILTAIAGRSETAVAVQEYGERSQNLIEGLTAQGRRVTAVPVYQWQFPEDMAPLRESLRRLLAGEVNIALFTTSIQIEHLLQIAEQSGEREAAVAALKKIFVGSIGPTCSEALRANGIIPALEPSHPKMGLLVREAAQAYGAGKNSYQA